MKKFKKIIGLMLTGALSLALSVTSLVATNTTANASSVVTPESVAANFTAGPNIVKAASTMPQHIIDRGYWEGPATGVTITFRNTGEENSVEYNTVFGL